MHKFAIFETA